MSGAPFDLGEGRTVDVTCSVGFAAFPLARAFPRALDWAATIALADEALYAVKRAGRDGWKGVLDAPATDEDALRQRARGPLGEWLDSGALRVVRSGRTPSDWAPDEL